LSDAVSKKIPLSVTVISKNEADRISYTIKSVTDWADEVLVIDSGSEDDTVSIASKLGAKVIYNEWQGYGPQKIFAENQCRNKWILNIDADEEISEKLKEEIIALFDDGEPDADAYHILIKIMNRFASKPSRFAPSNDPVRLYNKEKAGFKSSTVHDSVVLKEAGGKIGKLKNCVNHRCFRSFTHAVFKINHYTTMQAEDMYERGVKPKKIRIIFEPLFAFLKAYFLRRYFLLGVNGVIEGVIYAFSRTLRWAKLIELTKERGVRS
jgi:glycosyltransferase involved in cell wall biosynthesis